MAVVVDPNSMSKIKYEAGKGTETAGNIAVVTVKDSESSNIDVIAQDVINGGEVIAVKLSSTKTDEHGKVNNNGSNGYTTYFLDKMYTVKVDDQTQQAVSSALVINYDLYIANFNSINKRMGELREIKESIGLWGRVFGGAQKSNFGLGSSTEYITTQFGMDKVLELNQNLMSL